MHFFEIFLPKNLVMSKKSSTFAPAFEKKPLLNGVMVALQILVLSVWVRVLVEQQRNNHRLVVVSFCLNLWTRIHLSGVPAKLYFVVRAQLIRVTTLKT